MVDIKIGGRYKDCLNAHHLLADLHVLCVAKDSSENTFQSQKAEIKCELDSYLAIMSLILSPWAVKLPLGWNA